MKNHSIQTMIFVLLLIFASGPVMSQPSSTAPYDIPHCQSRDDATGCMGLLHVGETFSLEPGEEFSCRLDFSTCDGSLNNWTLKMVKIDGGKKSYKDNYDFKLYHVESLQEVDMGVLGGWYLGDTILDYDGAYCGDDIPQSAHVIVHITRDPNSRPGRAESFYLGSYGSLSR